MVLGERGERTGQKYFGSFLAGGEQSVPGLEQRRSCGLSSPRTSPAQRFFNAGSESVAFKRERESPAAPLNWDLAGCQRRESSAVPAGARRSRCLRPAPQGGPPAAGAAGPPLSVRPCRPSQRAQAAVSDADHRSRGSQAFFPVSQEPPSAAGRSRPCIAGEPAAPLVACRRDYSKGERPRLGLLLVGAGVVVVCCFLYICSQVKGCYSFFYIFAWKPRNFEVKIIRREEVIFLFQGHSHLPWQISVLKQDNTIVNRWCPMTLWRIWQIRKGTAVTAVEPVSFLRRGATCIWKRGKPDLQINRYKTEPALVPWFSPCVPHPVMFSVLLSLANPQ